MSSPPRSTSTTSTQGPVCPDDRERLLGQRGCVVWFTGLPGAGKTHLAQHVESRLIAEGRLAVRLDGDELRHGLCGDLGFSPEDRRENLRRVGAVAALMADAGIVVLASFVSPDGVDRAQVCKTVGAGRFVLVHVATPLEVCEQRDPKGLYRRARAGRILDFTGVNAPYEEPASPDVRVSTDELDVEAAGDAVWAALRKRGLLSPPDTDLSQTSPEGTS